jgi:hypothetical protein
MFGFCERLRVTVDGAGHLAGLAFHLGKVYTACNPATCPGGQLSFDVRRQIDAAECYNRLSPCRGKFANW